MTCNVQNENNTRKNILKQLQSDIITERIITVIHIHYRLFTAKPIIWWLSRMIQVNG